MLEDNICCKAMATNEMTTTKSKHIDIRYNFILEVVKSKAVVVTVTYQYRTYRTPYIPQFKECTGDY